MEKKASKITAKQQVGREGEDKVLLYLQHKGFRFVERNYSVPGYGELDLIFEKNGIFYVVEVKSRKYCHMSSFGTVSAFAPLKIRRLIRMAEIYRKDRCLWEAEIILTGALVLRGTPNGVRSLFLFSLLS